ncbi:MAG TPA: MYXO-CTERM sorting domain-containing protein, partial [Polyangia bacterium]|nr:MYXO-CTERM sorting domain-containing protein [Polyangia bacterium]
GGAAGGTQTGGNSGAAGMPSDRSENGSGCSCEVGGEERAATPILFLLAVFGVARRKRRPA